MQTQLYLVVLRNPINALRRRASVSRFVVAADSGSQARLTFERERPDAIGPATLVSILPADRQVLELAS